jgi:hypothetical protein
VEIQLWVKNPKKNKQKLLHTSTKKWAVVKVFFKALAGGGPISIAVLTVVIISV